MCRTILVIPCYNEEARLDTGGLRPLLGEPDLELLFVNDGSTDSTGDRLDALAEEWPARVSVLHLLANGGKAEAVRHGLLTALASGAEVVGYYDADLATPPSEMLRLLALIERGPWTVAMASRVRMLGAEIKEAPTRYFFARLFASFAARCSSLPVHDTQCGAKAFRRTTQLEDALAVPFRCRWTFDVELLVRLLTNTSYSPADFVEMPLLRWQSVPGSKLRARHWPLLVRELVRLWGVRRRSLPDMPSVPDERAVLYAHRPHISPVPSSRSCDISRLPASRL